MNNLNDFFTLGLPYILNEFIGIIISFIYVVLSFVIIRGFKHKHIISEFIERKLLHIAMANWWWIRIRFFKSPITACLGPLSFCFVNYYIEKGHHDYKYGKTQFALSLTICTFLSFHTSTSLMIATMAMMVLGFADPIAAIIGVNFSQGHKTCQGSIAFFCTSMVVIALVPIIHEWYFIFLAAILVTIVESKVLPNFDNLLIPFSTIIICLIFSKL